ncbi:MAG: bacteriocin family protein [Spirochaetes bacterium]|nr:bacteriocin family protein [Spirochaetota bacterium]MBN2771897.1 bacteriocin family protein [Spirochaetota bacterium]
MNLLRKEFAPLSEKAWEEINGAAKDTLLANLSARKFCDVKGPYGINHTCVNPGKLKISSGQKEGEVNTGIYDVMPLVEARKMFTLDIWDLDNLERGAVDVNLDSVVDAAQKMAFFEDQLVFNGYKDAGITGINQAVASDRIKMGLDKDSIMDGVSEALTRMRKSGITDNANFIVSPVLYKFLSHLFPGGTLGESVRKKIGGSVIYSESVDGALLIADREGDTELTIGLDFAVGYHGHNSKTVELFLTESLAFRVITPEAMIGFSISE